MYSTMVQLAGTISTMDVQWEMTWQHCNNSQHNHRLLMKSMVFWVVRLCSSEKSQHFRRKQCLHLEGRRVSHARNQQEAHGKPSSAWLMLHLAYSSTMKMEAVCSSETLDCFWIRWHYNQEDSETPLWHPQIQYGSLMMVTIIIYIQSFLSQ
jgi:hypothetical protein